MGVTAVSIIDPESVGDGGLDQTARDAAALALTAASNAQATAIATASSDATSKADAAQAAAIAAAASDATTKASAAQSTATSAASTDATTKSAAAQAAAIAAAATDATTKAAAAAAASLPTTQKGAASGVAPLDSSTKVANSYLRLDESGGPVLKGTYDAGIAAEAAARDAADSALDTRLAALEVADPVELVVMGQDTFDDASSVSNVSRTANSTPNTGNGFYIDATSGADGSNYVVHPASTATDVRVGATASRYTKSELGVARLIGSSTQSAIHLLPLRFDSPNQEVMARVRMISATVGHQVQVVARCDAAVDSGYWGGIWPLAVCPSTNSDGSAHGLTVGAPCMEAQITKRVAGASTDVKVYLAATAVTSAAITAQGTATGITGTFNGTTTVSGITGTQTGIVNGVTYLSGNQIQDDTYIVSGAGTSTWTLSKAAAGSGSAAVTVQIPYEVWGVWLRAFDDRKELLIERPDSAGFQTAASMNDNSISAPGRTGFRMRQGFNFQTGQRVDSIEVRGVPYTGTVAAPDWKVDYNAASLGGLSDSELRSMGFTHRDAAADANVELIDSSALGTVGATFSEGGNSYNGRPPRAIRYTQNLGVQVSGGQRAEAYAENAGNGVAAEQYAIAPGETVWFGFAVRLPVIPDGATWCTISQWKGSGYAPGATLPATPAAGSPTVALGINAGRFTLDVQQGTTGTNLPNLFGPNPIVAGKWYWMSICIRFVAQADAAMPKLGTFQVFLDNVEALATLTGQTMDVITKTGSVPDPIYLKQGVYRGNGSTEATMVAEFGLWRHGKSKAAVQPWT